MTETPKPPRKDQVKRKIVQIAVSTGGPEEPNCRLDYLYALCNDGSVWANYFADGWQPLTPIPQPKELKINNIPQDE